ncbi:hypothetical protein H8R18_05085 [Nanchangia anserum]|uniref:hypothetical protein n=1 Tax=Nanchangia anserum TaxID=2692125 RepID=UPI001883578D|nr:hypothetical protein [Nanchangia anserum]QOX81185.1 hypothetical protein H8R18_05085 [Nanchangia anserum]
MQLPFGHRPPSPSARTSEALKQIPKIRSVADALDVAMEIPATRVDAYVRKLIAEHPDATIADLESIATRSYIARAGALSGAVGAGAAVPGAGTAVATGLTFAELASFYANTSVYVLGMAKLHGIPTDNMAKRRALVASPCSVTKAPRSSRTSWGYRR